MNTHQINLPEWFVTTSALKARIKALVTESKAAIVKQLDGTATKKLVASPEQAGRQIPALIRAGPMPQNAQR
jgi:hypothetical protein